MSNTLVDLKKDMKALRSADCYNSKLEDIRNNLGLPTEFDSQHMRALIIYTVKKYFSTSIKADIVLMALGLLQNYDDNIVEKKLKVEDNALLSVAENFFKKAITSI